jgi:hypothetical protein
MCPEEPTLEYQHEQPSHILQRVATIGSVAFPVRQSVEETNLHQQMGRVRPLDREKPYQRSS